jgi:general secretion pathway protein K
MFPWNAGSVGGADVANEHAMTNETCRRGVALVAVLWSIALLSALVLATSVTFRGFAAIMMLDQYRIQGDSLLSAGLEAAASVLNQLEGQALGDRSLSVTLSTGSVQLRISDEGGRVDLGKAPPTVIAALFQSIGFSAPAARETARRVGDQRRSANAAGSNNSLESNFVDPIELLNRTGVSPRWHAALDALVSVYGSETVNPMTAPRGVIAALPGVDPAIADAFMRRRAAVPNDVTGLVSLLGPAKQFVAVAPQRIARVEMIARVARYTKEARAVIAVLPQDTEPYRVLRFAASANGGVGVQGRM